MSHTESAIRIYFETETIQGLYKAWLIHRRSSWKTRETVELATLEWAAQTIFSKRNENARTIKAKIKRRSAIEPTIGHMKAESKLGKNWLKGALGDAIHAVLCAAGYNIRQLIRKPRLFYAWILCLHHGTDFANLLVYTAKMP